MKRHTLLPLLLLLLTSIGAYSQNDEFSKVPYRTIAQGMDSPIPELQIVCFNKYFNKENMPFAFREKYLLNDKYLYKKKMLVEIFRTDKEGTGADKIDSVAIVENSDKIIISYEFVNSDTQNDDLKISSFLIVQIPKSRKKIEFVHNGKKSGKATNVYLK